MKIPDSKDIFSNIRAVETADDAGAQTISNFFKKSSQDFIEALEQIITDSEMMADIDIVEDQLRKLHLCCGGLIGLGKALTQKLYFLHYHEMTVASRELNETVGKVKQTNKDKETLAKGLISAEEGIIEMLENCQSNISGRISAIRGSRSKW